MTAIQSLLDFITEKFINNVNQINSMFNKISDAPQNHDDQ